MPDTKTRKVNAFDVIKKLADDNNKGFAMAPLSNVIEVKQNGARCTFLIGVDANAVKNYLLDKTRHGGLFLIDGDAYKAAEKELSEKPESADQSRATAIGFAEWIAEKEYTQKGGYWYEPQMHVYEKLGPCVAMSTEKLYDLYLLSLTNQNK